jgi:hypothetical protein
MKPLAFRAFLAIGIAVTLPSSGYCHTAPQVLRGKSIILTWTEERSQRLLGEGSFREVRVPFSHTMYISATGRPFDRFANNSRQTAHETVGTSAISAGGGPKQFQFSGRTMSLTTTPRQSGFARRYVVEFNENFTTCQANVAFAKRAGSDVVLGGYLSGRPVEIHSTTVTGVICSIREGNVFAQ